jgi:glycosyltransferase involved in cell wall biosynthesis
VRLLFVHEVNWRRKVTFEIHELPELLSLRGHEVDFIDFPEGERRRGLARLVDIRTKVEVVEAKTISGSSVRVITPGRVLPPPLDRLVASITFVPLLIRTLSKAKYDAIVLYSVPTTGWQTIFVAKMFGVPVLFRGIDVAHVLRKTRLARLVQIAERCVYRRAHRLSVNNIALRQYCITEGSTADRTTVDYPGLDTLHFDVSPETQELKASLGIGREDSVVLYMGTFFRFSGLDEVLGCFARRSNKNKHVKLVLVGDGELRPTLERLVAELGLSDTVIFTGFVDYRDLPHYLRLADVAITPFAKSLVTDKALPWKVVQYVASGLPVVSTHLEGLSGLFPDNHGVVYVNDIEDLWNEVEGILGNPNEARRLVSLGQDIVRTNCDWSIQTGVFEAHLRDLVASRNRSR